MSKRKKVSKEGEEPEVDDGQETFAITVAWSESRIEVEGWRFGSVGVHYGSTPEARFTHLPTGLLMACIEAPHGYILRAARILNADVDLSGEDQRSIGARLKAWLGSNERPISARDLGTKLLSVAEIPPGIEVSVHDMPACDRPKGRSKPSRSRAASKGAAKKAARKPGRKEGAA